MKNGSNKKRILICLAVMFLILTAFFSWNMPSLINAEKPFIDLAGSIGDSIGNASAAYEKAVLTPAPIDQPDITVTPEPTDIPDITIPEDTEVRIVIGEDDSAGSGESILLGEKRVLNAEDILGMISGEEFDGKSFVLVDNYAETEVFRKVKTILENSGKSFNCEEVE